MCCESSKNEFSLKCFNLIDEVLHHYLDGYTKSVCLSSTKKTDAAASNKLTPAIIKA